MTPRVDLPDAHALNGPTVDQIRVRGPESLPGDGGRPVEITLDGVAGTVPASAEVWVVNLDQAGPAVTVTADKTGAFHLSLLVRNEERLHIQARTAQDHSLALIVQVQQVDAGVGLLEWGERLDCLEVDPPLEVNVGRGDSGVELTNSCGEPIRFERVALRLGDAGFGLSELPVELPSGQSVRLGVTFNPVAGATGEQADILLLDVALPDGRTGRLALGIWASPEP